MPGSGRARRRGHVGAAGHFRLESLESRYMLSGEPVADFSLIDTNPTSDTYQQPVSPSDFAGQISGWYFGHST